MAPSAQTSTTVEVANDKLIVKHASNNTSAVIHRSLKSEPLQVAHAEGSWVTFSNGQRILDTTCGAAVACLGYQNERVKQAMMEQMDQFSYCNSMFFGTNIGEELAQELVDGTNGKMSKALMVCSGRLTDGYGARYILTLAKVPKRWMPR